MYPCFIQALLTSLPSHPNAAAADAANARHYIAYTESLVDLKGLFRRQEEDFFDQMETFFFF